MSAPKIIFKVGSSHSAEPAAKVQAQPVSKVQAQPVTKVETWPVAKVETLSTAKVQTHPITELKAWPVANLATQNVAGLKAQAKIEANKSKSEKPRRRKRTEEIKYFGLSWKKNKSDRSGSDFSANDVILKCKDGIGSAIKPICCLCKKSYCPDFLYVRCEQCKGNFVHHFVAYSCISVLSFRFSNF